MTLKTQTLETAKHALIFGAAGLSNKLIGFFLIPVYTNRLDPAAYGLLALLGVTGSVVGICLNMGLSSAIFKSYFSASSDYSKRQVVSTALFWMAGVVVVGLLCLGLLAGPLSGVVLEEERYRWLLILALATEGLSVLCYVPLATFRAKKQSARYGLFGVARFVTGACLNIYFLVVARLGVLGVLLAGLIEGAIFLSVGLFLIRHDISFSFSWSALKPMLSFGLPLVPSGLAALLLSSANRYFLEHLATRAEVGLYSLACSVGSAVNLLIAQPLQLIWLPAVFDAQTRPNPERFYSRMLTYGALVAAWVGLALSLLGKEVIAVMAHPRFFAAHKVIPLVVHAQVFYTLYFLVAAGIYVRAKTYYFPRIVGVAGATSCLLNWLLVPAYGTLGAGWAALISYLVLAAGTWIVSRRLYPVRYEWSRMGKIALASAAMLCAGRFVPEQLAVAVLAKIALLGVFWLMLAMLRFFDPSETAFVKSVLRKSRRFL